MSAFCINCEPGEAIAIQKGQPGHYSVDFGDARRVKKVLFNGEEVTKECRSCIVGPGGFIETYTKPKKRCDRCGKEVLRQVLSGLVVVEVGEI